MAVDVSPTARRWPGCYFAEAAQHGELAIDLDVLFARKGPDTPGGLPWDFAAPNRKCLRRL